MSVLHTLMDLAEDLGSQAMAPYYGADFGYGINPHSIYRRPSLFRLPISFNKNTGDVIQKPTKKGTVSIGKDGFQVCLDVQQFRPSELTVKVVNNHVVVEGKHEEREDDDSFVSRHFTRRYKLPKNYDSDKVISTLSSDGVLTVSVPKPAIEDKSAVKIIQIQQTGPAHLNVKENPTETEDGNPSDKKEEVQNGNKK